MFDEGEKRILLNVVSPTEEARTRAWSTLFDCPSWLWSGFGPR